MPVPVDSYLSVVSFLHIPLFHEFFQPSFAGRAVKCKGKSIKMGQKQMHTGKCKNSGSTE